MTKYRRPKLYADEDMEGWWVNSLKEQDWNIITNYRQREDRTHLAEAKQQKRWLIAHDKGYWDDQEHPWHTLKDTGIIILASKSALVVPEMLKGLKEAWKQGILQPGSKIKIKPTEIIRRRHIGGKVIRETYCL